MQTLREHSEKISAMWAYDLNGDITPDTIAEKSGKKIWWRCLKNPMHIFEKRVCEMFKKNGEPLGCIYCDGDRPQPFPGETDLFSVCPNAREMWDYDKNEGFDTKCINPGSGKLVWWKCSDGHSFKRRINSFVESQGCQECNKSKSTISMFPHLMKQWNYEKNQGINVNLISANSKNTSWWKCENCNYEWQAEILTRKVSKGLCPCCENRTVVHKGITDLFSMVPALKKDYNFEKNFNIDADSLSVTSLIPVYWKCHECGHDWSSSPSGRIKSNGGVYKISKCPVCARIKRLKSYAEDYPELSQKFLKDDNGCEFSDLISKDIKRKFWWHCEICNMNFESTLGAMIRSKDTKYQGCSYCSGKKATREKSFGDLHPEVMDEYDPQNTIDPFNITEYSAQKVKWICRNNSEHRWESSFSSRARGEGGCNKCRGWQYGKKLYLEHLEFEKFFDIEKNNKPFISYSYMSNAEVWWRCENGHSFKWMIMNFARQGKFECPICLENVLIPGVNDLESQYPDLAKEFDVEKNRLKPSKVSSTLSTIEFWWKCENGHTFKRSVWHRVSIMKECPVCNRTIIVKGINDLQTAFPEITKIWDYKSNGRGPDTITDISRKDHFFKCEHGHHYRTRLSPIINNSFKCMVCIGKIVQAGVNSLVDTDFELAVEWSSSNDRAPNSHHKSHKFSASWICPTCGGEYNYPINERSVGDDSCPYCNIRRVLFGYNSLIDTDPELSKEWNPSNKRGPENYLKSHSYRVSWICPTCGGEYNYPINERSVGDDSCPYCNIRRVLFGYNSLIDTDPELSKEWNPSNKRGPENYLKSNLYLASWICPTCGGEYNYPINERSVGDDSCPYCNSRRVLFGYNSLIDTDPELSKEWNPSNECGPENYLKNNSYRVSWICPTCGGEYNYPINKRSVGDDSCPYCNGTRVLPGYNSFKTKFPELMNEWDYVNNYTLCDADYILETMGDKIWWNCNQCNHKYYMSPKDKVKFHKRSMKSCPYCKGLRQNKIHFF